jgi:hypothetical protein
MERRPEGESHRLPKPDHYDHYKDAQPYGLRIHVHGGEIYGESTGWLEYQVFKATPATKGPLWEYRRLVDAAQFPGKFSNDIAMFNWPGNDYRDVPPVDRPADVLASALQDAKRVSLGFAYWLQTDALNPDTVRGFPHLRIRPDVMGTADGLSKHPYIRECRRIVALKTIIEQEIAVAHQPGPRATRFHDSVGVGWYPIDIHQVSADKVGTSTRTRPFQIPMGALIPRRVENLLAANKNIGTTHITNGCFRLHPVEWNIGEAAGLAAAFAVNHKRSPRATREDPKLLRMYQDELLSEGVPLCWLIDVPVQNSDFASIQRMVIDRGFGGEDAGLEFKPNQPVSGNARIAWSEGPEHSRRSYSTHDAAVTRGEFAVALATSGQPE